MKRHLTDSQVIQTFIDSFKATLYFSMPGSVKAYYPNTRTADVQPMTNDPRKDLATGGNLFEPWQPLLGLPVMWPRFSGGTGQGSFTIAGMLNPNDQVLLEAFDLDPSTWLAQGRSNKPVDPAHVARFGGHWRVKPSDLASPFVGLSSGTPEPGTNCLFLIGPDGSQQQLRFNNDGSISIGGDQTDGFVALAALVDKKFADFATWVKTGVAPGGSGGPVTYADPAPTEATAATIAKAK